VVICLERGADCLHIVQLMPLPSQNPIISCLVYIQTGCTFLQVVLEKKTVKRVYLLIVGTILPTEEVIRPSCLCACLLLKPVAMDSSAALSERITSDSDSSSIMLETMCCRVVSLSMRRLEMRFSCFSV